MKIVIYDTQHYEMVNVLFNIFDIEGNELLLLIDEKVYRKLSNNASTADKIRRQQFVIKQNGNSMSFYSECEHRTKEFSPDFMVMNTIDKDYKLLWRFLKKVNFPYLVTLHNINTWLNTPFTLNSKALSNYYYRNKIVRKSTLLAVQEELFTKFIKDHKLYSRKVVTIPHTLKEVESTQVENKKIRVSLPGAIDGWRRNYDFALEVIEKVNDKSDQFQFIFLGQVIGNEGEKYFERIKELQKRGLEVEHYYDEKSNVTFDKQMQTSDLVFLPLKVNTKYEGINEIYGTTKVTGVIYDMMRFAKPGVVTSEMVIPPTMSSSLLPYDSADQLVEILISLSSNRENLMELKKKAALNSEYYRLENIRNRLLPILNTEFNVSNR